MRHYLKQNKLLLFLTAFFCLISSLGYVFIAILLQELLDIAMAGEIQKFAKIIIFSLFYFALLGIFLFLQSLFSKKIIGKVTYLIRSKTFMGIMNHNMEDFEKKNTADYISSITNDVKMIEDNYLQPMFDVIQYSIIFIASFGTMIYFDLIVTVCVVITIAIMFIVPSLFGKIMENRQSVLSQKLSELTSDLKDILSGFEVIKSYSMKTYILKKFDKSNDNTMKTKYLVDKVIALNEGLSSFLALIVQVVVLFLSAYFIITGRISVGALLGMVQASSNLANPLLMIFNNVPKIKSVSPIIKKLNDLSEVRNVNSSNQSISEFNHCISMKGLSFSYDEQKEVLKDIDCYIRKGEKHAIVGKSGCGKTTLVKLLIGYYSSYNGEILYDSTELHSLDKGMITQLSSLIHQNIYMFDESIYDNICLHEDFSKKEVDEAIELSGLNEFISQLPDGLSYQVGENGSNLSGGQRQRIAVARALIRKKPILILDEGTSAIDMQTAFDIESRLLKMEGLTMITITHNMKKELLEMYDNIIYMENGTIIDNGTFDKLINTSPAFLDYFELKK